jgi:hypothetical protein
MMRRAGYLAGRYWFGLVYAVACFGVFLIR